MTKCDMCGKQKKNVTTEPSRSQLIFGGFRVKYEQRCPACERKVAAQIERMLRSTRNG